MAAIGLRPLHPGDGEHDEIRRVVEAMLKAIPDGASNATVFSAFLAALCGTAEMLGMSADQVMSAVALDFRNNARGAN